MARLKRCKKCRVDKPTLEFFKASSGAPKAVCKECVKLERERLAQSLPDTEWPERHFNRTRQGDAKARRRRLERNRQRAKHFRRRNPREWQRQQAAALAREKERGHPSAAKRRALRYGAFIEEVDKRTLWDLFEGVCGICGEKVDSACVTIDHIIPLSKGGTHCYANTQPAHGPCNRRKSNKLPEEVEWPTAA